MYLFCRADQETAKGIKLALTAGHNVIGQGTVDVLVLLGNDAAIDRFDQVLRQGNACGAADVCCFFEECVELFLSVGPGEDGTDRFFIIGGNDVKGAVRNIFDPDLRADGSAFVMDAQAFMGENFFDTPAAVCVVGAKENTGKFAALFNGEIVIVFGVNIDCGIDDMALGDDLPGLFCMVNAVLDEKDDRICTDAGNDCLEGSFEGLIFNADKDYVLNACVGRCICHGRMGYVFAEIFAVQDEPFGSQRFFTGLTGNQCYLAGIIGAEERG